MTVRTAAGPGMVMLAEPIERTLDAVKTAGGGRVVYLTPQGQQARSPQGDGVDGKSVR